MKEHLLCSKYATHESTVILDMYNRSISMDISEGVTGSPVPESMNINLAEVDTPGHWVEMNPRQDNQ